MSTRTILVWALAQSEYLNDYCIKSVSNPALLSLLCAATARPAYHILLKSPGNIVSIDLYMPEIHGLPVFPAASLHWFRFRNSPT